MEFYVLLYITSVCCRSVNLGEPNVNDPRYLADGREGRGGFSNVVDFVRRGKRSE